jgi:hypothetical protein
MPINVSGSDGTTIISGSQVTTSGSDGESALTPSGSAINVYALALTGACDTIGEMQVVTSGSCQRLYICMSGTAGNAWTFLTGSKGCEAE